MKCPHCGQWNRASLPRCIKCGTDLNHTAENTRSSWQESMRKEQPQKIYIRIDDEGRSTADTDPRELLAREMNHLQERKERAIQDALARMSASEDMKSKVNDDFFFQTKKSSFWRSGGSRPPGAWRAAPRPSP